MGCKSVQKHKNIVGATGECIFRGSIRVDKVAQKTDSEQICRSLLVSDKSRVKAMPSLQIQADDVVCSHGAAVTQLDKNEIFYLTSRGLSTSEAKRLLLVAFPEDLVAPLRKHTPRALERLT